MPGPASMIPTVFGKHAGWLHEGDGTCGVVICPPMGHEAMWLHRGLRQLAQRLSEQGMPVLRFDYAGTGDSAGVPGAGAIDVWKDGVAAAMAHLVSIAGVHRIVLLGVRLGAALAAEAAARARIGIPIEALVLLEPVVSGRAYRRELDVLRQFGEETGTPACDAPWRVLGYPIDVGTVERLQTLDLRRATRRPAPRVLIVASRQGGAADEVAHAYRKLGAQVDAMPFADYTDYMQPAWQSRVPVRTFAAVADWLARVPAQADARRADAGPPMNGRSAPCLALRHATERPVPFDSRGLFGILCEPDGNRMPGVAVLLPNTGGTCHVGEARFGVECARRLADAGVASFRIDVGGMGDSVAAGDPGDPEWPLDAASRDTDAAAAWLAAHGYPHVIMLGICSGAYLALHAARSRPAVAGLMLVNFPRFGYPAGFTIRGVGEAGSGSAQSHVRSMWKAGKWLEVVRGQASLVPVARTLSTYAWARARGMAAALAGAMLGRRRDADAMQWMRALEQRGVETRLLYGPDDPGLDALHLTFGTRARRLHGWRHVRAAVMDSLDHELVSVRAREAVMQSLLGDLLPACRHGALDRRQPESQRTMKKESAGERRLISAQRVGEAE